MITVSYNPILGIVLGQIWLHQSNWLVLRIFSWGFEKNCQKMKKKHTHLNQLIALLQNISHKILAKLMYILQKWLFFFEWLKLLLEEQKIKDGIKKNWRQKSYEVSKRKDLKKKLHSWMVMVFSYSNNISWMKSSKLSKFHSSELSKFHTKIGVS